MCVYAENGICRTWIGTYNVTRIGSVMCQPNSLNPGSIQWTWEGLLNERTDVFCAGAAFISLHPVHYTTKGCQWELVGSSIRQTWWGQKIVEARASWNFLSWSGLLQEWALVWGRVFPYWHRGFWSRGLNSGCAPPWYTHPTGPWIRVFTYPQPLLTHCGVSNSAHSSWVSLSV